MTENIMMDDYVLDRDQLANLASEFYGVLAKSPVSPAVVRVEFRSHDDFSSASNRSGFLKALGCFKPRDFHA